MGELNFLAELLLLITRYGFNWGSDEQDPKKKINSKAINQ